MRARLLWVLPDLSHLFGLKPSDIDDLNPYELESYLNAREAFLKQR